MLTDVNPSYIEYYVKSNIQTELTIDTLFMSVKYAYQAKQSKVKETKTEPILIKNCNMQKKKKIRRMFSVTSLDG